MEKLNLKRYYDFAIKTAQKTGQILLNNYKKDYQIGYKDEGKSNLVTEIDHLAEDFIVAAIKKNFPGHCVLSEEGGNCGTVKSDYQWIIDPIDGTTNYAHGYPFFCVSIALEIKKEIVLGVVYAPMLDELFRAAKGNGAFLNNEAMKVSSVETLDTALMCTGFSEYFSYKAKEKKSNLPLFEHFLSHSQAIRRSGSAAIDLCSVAAGRLDGYWELGLKPWDIAAGKLIVEEAGGKVSNMDGSALILDGCNIVASNNIIHKEMIKNLQGAMRENPGVHHIGKKKIPFGK